MINKTKMKGRATNIGRVDEKSDDDNVYEDSEEENNNDIINPKKRNRSDDDDEDDYCLEDDDYDLLEENLGVKIQRKRLRQTFKSKISSTDLINTLPTECLARIFMCLDVFDRIEIRKICKNWQYTCDNFAWYDIKKFVCHATIGRSYDNRKMTPDYKTCTKKLLRRFLLRMVTFLDKVLANIG